jgi:hypothetical protein
VSLPLLPLPPQPLQPRLATPFEALLHRPIALGALPFDPLPTRPLGALPPRSLAFEPLRDRLAGAPEGDNVPVTAAKARRVDRPAAPS